MFINLAKYFVAVSFLILGGGGLGALAQLPWAYPSLSAGVPAACGAVAGQLTAWNPSDKGANITLSNSNFTASNTAAASNAVRAVNSKSSGKWYFLAGIDATTGTTGWIVGVADSTSSLSQSPGNNTHSVGCYSGNFIYNGGLSNYNSQTFTGAGYAVIAFDMTNKKAWCNIATNVCAISDTGWSGPTSFTGNPSTNTDGFDISGFATGAVFPIWGSQAASNTGTLYTNFQATNSSLSGFKYFDQP